MSHSINMQSLWDWIKGTSKNPTRHAELVSASPLYQGIADHVRNDDCAKSVVFRSPLKMIPDIRLFNKKITNLLNIKL